MNVPPVAPLALENVLVYLATLRFRFCCRIFTRTCQQFIDANDEHPTVDRRSAGSLLAVLVNGSTSINYARKRCNSVKPWLEFGRRSCSFNAMREKEKS